MDNLPKKGYNTDSNIRTAGNGAGRNGDAYEVQENWIKV